MKWHRAAISCDANHTNNQTTTGSEQKREFNPFNDATGMDREKR
jgi:hypothetical protein